MRTLNLIYRSEQELQAYLSEHRLTECQVSRQITLSMPLIWTLKAPEITGVVHRNCSPY
ncbi:hypothetical protein VCSRO186_1566 [Vibrio cholerae]|uniref:Uncharacterized protein n=1 Tax=Shewanella xiamenensis TaxID=332186 RepID=A0AAE4PWM0_9GAMM|nr:hypothetical protein [Shewanella xiamenensis]BCK02089.1 hypothetical protein VCSRO162_0150 [Vibrio cholerae]MDV5389249.1 hypothetical protein [Shewanella xiamenensis]GHX97833.1 hypothetical protein VCSRO210_2563 [Vibrio cholerae]GHY20999.1 hypothetical protein VCSRO113_1541 [Vibrio cholerae]GIB32077.1 hypothetical protein VCSRO186_1566 [Vibrio cholerae]